jgi:hypothetical protein
MLLMPYLDKFKSIEVLVVQTLTKVRLGAFGHINKHELFGLIFDVGR